MLKPWQIEKLREERERQQERERPSLRIPAPEWREENPTRSERDERGSTVVSFEL